jgi:glutathione S-transferase
MRARLALAVSGQAHELREIVLRNKPAEMLAASPKGTVPVLLLPDGQVIDESLNVMLWALAQNDPFDWLTPKGGDSREMHALIAGNDGEFKRSLDRYKYPNRYIMEWLGSQQDFALHHRTAAALWLASLDDRLGEGWLFGARTSLADLALLPFVRQFAHTDAAWFASQPWQRLQGWLSRFEASALFADVMEKHEPWQAPPAISTMPEEAV